MFKHSWLIFHIEFTVSFVVLMCRLSTAVFPLLLNALSPADSIPSSLGKLWLSKFENAACAFTFQFSGHCFYSSGEINARSRETILSLKRFPDAKTAPAQWYLPPVDVLNNAAHGRQRTKPSQEQCAALKSKSKPPCVRRRGFVG